MNQRGFTLIELMTTLAVVMILAAISAPSFGDMLMRFRADTAISNLTTDLALARMTAISRGKAVTACPSRDATTCVEDGDWSEGWLVFVDPDRNRRINSNEQIISAGQSARFSSLVLRSTEGRTTLRYLPSGLGSGSNVTITACLKGRIHAQLVMNNAGRVRVERPKGTPPNCPASSTRE